MGDKPKEGGQLPAGHVLDTRYRIVRLIKAGGMGAVYQVEDAFQGGKIGALKEMLDGSSNAEERQDSVNRFLSEVQVLTRLTHPGIPRFTNSFMEKNSYYFVMEYVEGIDLGHYLEDHGAPGLPAPQVIDWAVQILSALEYLHSLKPPVVHRDIKPSNILYRPSDGRVLLVDFGIARVTNPAEGFWIGTPGYAPAEQQFGKHEPRSDLYALAASMHELLTGVKPKSFEFPSFQELKIEIQPQLEEVVELGLATFPEDRYANATQMREALEAVPGWSPSVAALSSVFTFSAAVQDVKAQMIDPLLKKLIARYGNECLTPFLPSQLEYLVFTLGMATPFELIINCNDREEKLEFYEKQGILERVQLGRVDPRNEGEVQTIPTIIDAFCGDYERFKFSS